MIPDTAVEKYLKKHGWRHCGRTRRGCIKASYWGKDDMEQSVNQTTALLLQRAENKAKKASP